MSKEYTVAVVGGGPAGAQCGLWLKKLGISAVIIEKDQIGGLQASSPYTNSWLAMMPATTMAQDLAKNMKMNLSEQECEVVSGEVSNISRVGSRFLIQLTDSEIISDYVVLATGTKERDSGFAGHENFAIGLVGAAQVNPEGKSLCILGGGDAACEVYTFMKPKAEKVTLFARTRRAGNPLWDSVPDSDRIIGDYSIHESFVKARNEIYNFDKCIICYGWGAVIPNNTLDLNIDKEGFVVVDSNMQTSTDGVFAIGDINNRPWPCVTTAMSDAVFAAKVIQEMEK